MPTIDDLILKFMKSTRIVDNHWVWIGAKNKGHALVTIDNKSKYLHRYIFCLMNNLDYDDSNFMACHKLECPFKSCWNPECIYMGTNSTNQKDLVTLGLHRESIKTHCPRGHRLFHKAKNGKRVCLECNRLRDKNRKRITRNGRRITIPGTRKI